MTSKKAPAQWPLRKVRGSVLIDGVTYESLACGHQYRVRAGVAGRVNITSRPCSLCASQAAAQETRKGA